LSQHTAIISLNKTIHFIRCRESWV